MEDWDPPQRLGGLVNGQCALRGQGSPTLPISRPAGLPANQPLGLFLRGSANIYTYMCICIFFVELMITEIY